MRIAVIGSGISGLAAARVLARFGHDVIVYERDHRIGGIWAHTYPQVRLQNVAEHYRLSDFPWPFPPDQHPTADQVLRYIAAMVEHFRIDVRLGHEVKAMKELPDGWELEIAMSHGRQFERFDHVIVAVGLYSDEQAAPALPGRERFRGQVLTERDITTLSLFDGKRVAVVGFGKTAVDLATFAAERGARVNHIFRAPRWLLPRIILGRHMSDVVTARASTRMLPSWVHPNRQDAFVHRWLGLWIRGYWRMTEGLFRATMGLHGWHRDPAVKAKMAVLEPGQPLTYQMRAAAALAPDTYYPLVRSGAIEPIRGTVAGLSENAVLLEDGTAVPADLVVLAVGWQAPSFRFLPERYRTLMTNEPGGTQLYRHMIHPRIPRLAFAGYNHAFLHIPTVEVAATWYGAVIAGDILLPPVEEMEASTERVATWKRENTLFEPTRAHGIGNRFHHYLDVLLMELGVRFKRKSNPLAEAFLPYMAGDYAGVFNEYEAARRSRGPRRTLPYDT